MEVLYYPRCAGLDVHKDTVVASARLAAGRTVSVEVQTFPTTTAGLLALSAWLAERGCTHVAMEATGPRLKAGPGPRTSPRHAGSPTPPRRFHHRTVSSTLANFGNWSAISAA